MISAGRVAFLKLLHGISHFLLWTDKICSFYLLNLCQYINNEQSLQVFFPKFKFIFCIYDSVFMKTQNSTVKTWTIFVMAMNLWRPFKSTEASRLNFKVKTNSILIVILLVENENITQKTIILNDPSVMVKQLFSKSIVLWESWICE